MDPSRRSGGRRRRGRRRLLSVDLAEPQDRLDPGYLALGLDDLAGGLEPLGLALEAEAEEVVLRLLEQQLELLAALVAEFGGLAHRRILGASGLRGWAGGRRTGTARGACGRS